jgi:hypothetical protein
MALMTSYFREEKANRNCVVIYPDGRYRREKSTQAHGGNVRLQAFEGSLNSTQVAELRALLDAAELKNLKLEASCKQAFGEGDFTSLSIPRQLSVQRLRFDHCFQVLGNRDKPGGYSGTQYVVAPEEHVLNPVREWLKNNVDKQNLPLLPDPTPTNCNPVH